MIDKAIQNELNSLLKQIRKTQKEMAAIDKRLSIAETKLKNN